MSSPLTTAAGKSRIGFAISTKDRTEFTGRILPGLDCGGFDLIWCDGSVTPEGRAFADPRHFSRTPVREICLDVRGGPDAAIQFSLKRLLALGYDYVGLIENDIQLKPGWLPAMLAAWNAAGQAGFEVGAITARTAASRVLAGAPEYAVLWNLGAGMSLFSRAGAEAVLADYQLPTARKIHEFYLSRLGIDLADAWELFMEQPDRALGADWHYAASMLKRGMVSLGVVPNHGENIDVDFEQVCGTQFVRSARQPLPGHCVTPQRLLAALKSGPPGPAPRNGAAKAKVAEDYCRDQDLTGVQNNSEFERFLREVIGRVKPRFIVETGTYLGQGTTRIISSALKDNGLADAKFYSIECNPEHHRQAVENLSRSGLLPFVKPLHGISVPRGLLPDAAAIRKETIDNAGGDLFVDHREEKRIQLYLSETNFPGLADDLLGRCLRECGGQPDLLLLDSAGHMGNVEFNYALQLLRGPCYLALDDIRHVKHARSVEQMKADPRFEILAVTEEKFGSLLARFTPAATPPLNDNPERILFVRTDSIGDAALAAAMLPHIRERYPRASIAVLCQEHVAELYEVCPQVSTIVCYQKQKLADPAYWREIAGDLRQIAPDLILNGIYSREAGVEKLLQELKGTPAIAMEGDLANITAEERRHADTFYAQVIPNRRTDSDLELDHHRDFLAALGIVAADLKPMVWLTESDRAAAATRMTEHQLDPANTIALVPGAQHDIKIYPRYVEALKNFTDYRFLLLGGERDVQLCEAIAAHLPNQPVNLAGRTTLRELAALISRCQIYVGADTGAAHFACALGVPNVVVVGGGAFNRFFPYSPLTSVVSLPLACLGCGWQCPYSQPHCIKDLPAGPLTEAVKRTLTAISDLPRIFVPSSNVWQPRGSAPAWSAIERFIPSTAARVVVVATKPAPNSPANQHAPTSRQACLRVEIKAPAAKPAARNGHAAPPAGGSIAENLTADFLKVADAHFSRGDFKSCLTALQWALETKPQDPAILTLIANVHFRAGDFELACRAFHRAVEFDPDNAGLHAQLAAARLKTSDEAGARAALEHALQLDGNCIEALGMLANSKLQENCHAEAAALYHRLLASQPDRVDCLLALGKCLYHTGDEAGARRAYERVAVLEPANAIATEALQILGAKTNGAGHPVAPVNAFAANGSAPAGRAAPPVAPAHAVRPAAAAGNGAACARPARDEEAARNQKAVDWWRKFIFESFDRNPEVSERKFLDRFRAECGSRWQYVCQTLNLDINCCAEGAVLDVGNGPCGLINSIPARVKVGVDLNNELYQRNGILYNVNQDAILLPARGEAIPLLDNSFDFITCVNMLDQAINPEGILSEVRRLLKPGGIFWLSVDTRKGGESQTAQPAAVNEETVREWAGPLVCVACRTDQPCYNNHPTNKRVDAWFQKPASPA